MTLLLVVLGAAVGAPLRYYTDRAVQARSGSPFPWGTLVVNVAGSLLFGVLVGGAASHGVPDELLAAAGVGFCGALTTYSAFAEGTVRLALDGSLRSSCLNAVLNLALGVGAAALGMSAGLAIAG